jgi:beta-N-acetylhexosaminidase
MGVRAGLIASLFIFLSFSSASAKQKPQPQPAPVRLDHDGEKWAEKTLKKMSVEEKIGQLFMVWVRADFLNVQSPVYVQLRDSMLKYHLGSFAMTVRWDPPYLYRSEPYEAAELLNRLQQDSPLPLIIAADFERGLSMRLVGTTEFPHAMAFGATGNLKYAEDFGRITAQESRAIGVQWNFFPDADVNSNPLNPVINIRSFGEDPQQVGDMVAAYIRGARANGMLTTAKHFPGHGDTATDSHLGLAEVTNDMARLNSVELPPFRKAMEAGVDSIMVAHVTVPALDPAADHVATTSPAIVTGLLKDKLGFQGVVVTDALDMNGLTRLYTATPGREAVDAFKAGCDLLIIPDNLDAAYRAMLAAAQSGEISPQRLDSSVLKLLKAKASIGLNKKRLVDITTLDQSVGKPESQALGQEIADDAVTLVRDNGKVLPLKRSGTVSPRVAYQPVEEVRDDVVGLVFSEDLRTDVGRVLEHQLKTRIPDSHVIYVDSRTANAMTPDVMNAVNKARTVIAAVYMIPTPGARTAGSMTFTDEGSNLLKSVLDRAADRTVVVAMGSPFIAQHFPSIQNYLCTFSNVSVSETSAVKALFAEIPIRGHLPVTIPDFAQLGAGIERARH